MLILFSWMRHKSRNNRGQVNATHRDVFKNLHNSVLNSCPRVKIKCSGFYSSCGESVQQREDGNSISWRGVQGRKQERHGGKTWGLILADRSHVNKYFWSKTSTKISFSGLETWRVPSYRQLLMWNLQNDFLTILEYFEICAISYFYTSVGGETEFTYEALIFWQRTVFFSHKNNKLGF